MMNTTFFKKLTVVLVALFFASCDKDYTSLGADIVGNENFAFGPGKQFGVKAYNQKVPAVQTNNQPVNQLGIYENEVFGTTTANFVTQLAWATVKPTFTSHVEIDSVLLTVPYFSRKTSTDANGKGIYKLDSIYGSGIINLEVYRNGFYLRDFSSENNAETAQKYYSNEDNTGANFNGVKIGTASNAALNNDPDVKQNTAFIPIEKEYIRFKPNADLSQGPKTIANIESRNAPRMSLKLDASYFQTEILNKAINPANEEDFANDNAFEKYFKGIYFKVVSGVPGRVMMLDFSKGDVTIFYKQDKTKDDPAPTPVKEMKSLVMKMSGNTVNLFNNVDNAAYSNAVTNPDKINGDKNIYLKGGEGSTAYVELFSGTELQELRDSNILINDASLTFTVDQTGMSANYNRPLRIYVFDADNNKPIIDYYDSSTNATNTKLNKRIFGGSLEQVAGNKYKYRVRITDHINNIIKTTTEKNVRLGVVVTENINMANHLALKTEISDPDPLVPGSTRKFSKLPASSVINPLGIKLFGTHSDVPADDRIKFEIFYTKPN